MDFLDLTMNIVDGSHIPYCKPNAEIEYVNVRSDHPSTRLNEVPKDVNLLLNKLRSNKEVCDEKKVVTKMH